METILAFIVGGLVAAGTYLLLQRNLVRNLLGVIVLMNAVNLLIFTLGGLTRGEAPIHRQDGVPADFVFANPLPQALILTSIVISFGLAAFFLALVYRSEKTFDTLDSDELRSADVLDSDRK